MLIPEVAVAEASTKRSARLARAFRDDALALLLTMVEAEPDPMVLTAITVGFGNLGDHRCETERRCPLSRGTGSSS